MLLWTVLGSPQVLKVRDCSHPWRSPMSLSAAWGEKQGSMASKVFTQSPDWFHATLLNNLHTSHHYTIYPLPFAPPLLYASKTQLPHRDCNHLPTLPWEHVFQIRTEPTQTPSPFKARSCAAPGKRLEMTLLPHPVKLCPQISLSPGAACRHTPCSASDWSPFPVAGANRARFPSKGVYLGL